MRFDITCIDDGLDAKNNHIYLPASLHVPQWQNYNDPLFISIYVVYCKSFLSHSKHKM